MFGKFHSKNYIWDLGTEPSKDGIYCIARKKMVYAGLTHFFETNIAVILGDLGVTVDETPKPHRQYEFNNESHTDIIYENHTYTF